MADSVIVKIDGDDSGFQRALSGIESAAKKGLGMAVKGITAIGTAFTGVTAAALKFSGDLEQNLGGSEAVFGEYAAKIQAKAETAFSNMGLSASDFLATANKMGALFKGAGFEMEEAADLSAEAMQRAADVASIMGIDVSMAMESIAGAAKGNFTMMDNLGVAMNDTTLNAYALEKGIGKTTQQMTNQEKVALAMEMFLDRTAYAAGNYAKENKTLAGSLGTAKAALQNFISGAGDVDDVVDALSNATDVVVENMGDLLPKLVKGLSGIVSKLTPKIPKILRQLVPAVVSLVDEMVDAIRETAPQIAVALADGIGEAIPALKPFAKLIKLVTKNLEALTSAVVTGVVALKTMMVIKNIATAISTAQIAVTAYTAATQASANVSILLASTMKPLEILIGLLTGKISLATAAQMAWNAVMAMNPMTLAIIGITALSAAVVGVSVAYDNYLSRTSEIVIATQTIASASADAAKQTQELNNALLSISETAETTIMDAEAEAYANNMLAQELYNLAGKASITAAEKQRMQVIVDQLNSSVEDLNLALNNETGQLNLTEEAVKGVIAQKLEMAKTNAMQELYTEQLKAQYKAEADALVNAQKLAEAQEQLNSIMEQGEKRTYQYGQYVYTGTFYTNEQRKAMDNLKEAIGNYSSALQTSQSAVSQSQQNVQALATVTGTQLPESFTTAQQSSQGFFDALLQQTETTSSQSESKGDDFAEGYVKGITSPENMSAAYKAGYSLGLEALRGTATAQDSNSPAKESEELGGDYGQGYVLGIEDEQNNVNKAAGNLADGAIIAIREKKTEVRKVLDEMNEVLLDSEKKYNAESERLKDSRSEADNEYLESLKKTAIEERNIFEAARTDIENMKNAIIDSVEEVDKAQESMANKLKNFGDLYYTYTLPEITIDGVTHTPEMTKLSNLSKQTETLERYYDNLQRVKNRGAVPDEFFEQLRDMSVEEGLQFSDALLKASDAEFQDFIDQWIKKQNTSEKISAMLFADERKELEKQFENEWGDLPEDFFGLGKESAEQYGIGFMEKIKSVFSEMAATVQSSFLNLNPTLMLAGAGGGTVTSNAYSTTYNLYGNDNNDLTAQIESMETRKRMAGIGG